jgi:formamidopyrimidine-DNA glycosylase
VPELPEVETIVRGLKKKLEGRTIGHVEIFRRSILAGAEPKELCSRLEGLKIGGVLRRGKFIVFRVGCGHLLSHLRMTGKYLLFDSDEYKELPHVRMSVHLDNRKYLVYQDVRCLGTICFYPPQAPVTPLERLGPEPLSDEFTPAALAEILSKTKRGIKTVLMDQRKLAGIGNIYASEILFHSRIHPTGRTDGLGPAAITSLFSAIKNVLNRSIDLHGTTFSDYRDVDNRRGGFQEFLCVYQRAGRPCRDCGETVQKSVQGGRSSFFCPGCQPAYSR